MLGTDGMKTENGDAGVTLAVSKVSQDVNYPRVG